MLLRPLNRSSFESLRSKCNEVGERGGVGNVLIIEARGESSLDWVFGAGREREFKESE